MRILWVTPKWTLPANDGARVATYQLLKNLVHKDLIIDYFSISHPDDIEDEKALRKELPVENVYWVKRSLPKTLLEKVFYYGLSFLFKPTMPLTIASFKSSEIEKTVKSILKNEEYDYVVADGLHCTLPFISSSVPIVYRSHNVESDIWKRAGVKAKNPLLKLFFTIQFFAMKNFEDKVVRHSHLVFPISDDDKKTFEISNPSSTYETIPIGMDFTSTPWKQSKIESELKLLFLGRLDWGPNKDGLIWFLDNVWSKVESYNHKLVIAGSGNSEWLEAYEDYDNIEFLGFVEDVTELYTQVDCSIVPIFYGSGTRIKLIESVARKTPFISTEMGALGSSLKKNIDYVGAESAEEWLKAINNFSTEKADIYLKNAHEILKEKYDEKAVASKLLHKLLYKD
ncbi:MAG: glycosyltransferase [Bdellovibrionota bacterium]|nr:glycosyltransferase [Bdellovibrionota bacterium]